MAVMGCTAEGLLQTSSRLPTPLAWRTMPPDSFFFLVSRPILLIKYRHQEPEISRPPTPHPLLEIDVTVTVDPTV